MSITRWVTGVSLGYERNGSRNSGLGFFGVYSWVERTTGHFGIICPFIRDDAFRFWSEMEGIRDAVSVD